MIVLISTFVIDHFDLFGVRQVWLHLRGIPYTPPQFTPRGWYSYVRHPIYFGFIVAFWATPAMTIAHLVCATATTVPRPPKKAFPGDARLLSRLSRRRQERLDSGSVNPDRRRDLAILAALLSLSPGPPKRARAAPSQLQVRLIATSGRGVGYRKSFTDLAASGRRDAP
jgi:hypothetical protein